MRGRVCRYSGLMRYHGRHQVDSVCVTGGQPIPLIGLLHTCHSTSYAVSCAREPDVKDCKCKYEVARYCLSGTGKVQQDKFGDARLMP